MDTPYSMVAISCSLALGACPLHTHSTTNRSPLEMTTIRTAPHFNDEFHTLKRDLVRPAQCAVAEDRSSH